MDVPVKATVARRGSDEHRAKQRQNALMRRKTGRHPNMVAPTIVPRRRHAVDDNLKFSIYPGPSRLNDGPSASELIAWRRERTRKDSST